MLDGVGRWLGVAGDDGELRARREAYLASRRTTANAGPELSSAQAQVHGGLTDKESYHQPLNFISSLWLVFAVNFYSILLN